MISDLVVDSDNNVFGLRFRKSGSFQSSNYDFATECYEQNTEEMIVLVQVNLMED